MEIHFHKNKIDCLNLVQNNLKTLFDKIDEIQFMYIEKELISLYPLFFKIIEDYFFDVKELPLKLCGCEKDFPMKFGLLTH